MTSLAASPDNVCTIGLKLLNPGPVFVGVGDTDVVTDSLRRGASGVVDIVVP